MAVTSFSSNMVAIRRLNVPMLLNFFFSFSRDYTDLLPSPQNADSGKGWSTGVTLDEERNQFWKSAQVAGISRIGFLRHGKTGPAPDNGVDFDRHLTEQGRSQAADAGEKFGRDLLPFHNTILASHAPRTMDTARIFLQNSVKNPKEFTIQPVEGLYDGTMQPEGSQLFRKLGYAPLNDYVNNEDNHDREASRKVLGSYAHLAMHHILENLFAAANQEEAKDSSDDGKTLWVVGHAIYLPAAALRAALLTDCDESSIDTILSISTREAEGFLVDMKTAKVSSLTRES